ncbi:MAG: methyltransferase domain-containing protein, partial [Acidobacteria bacterium]|nr:methyltransferase domain-containing protein [Acidobacteriota bacterium]
MALDGDEELLLLALGQDTPIALGADLTIHEDDAMLRVLRDRADGDHARARAMYLESGLALWRTLRRVVEWRFGAAGQVGRLLDFASGYGRVTRFLVREVAPERVWVADVAAAAVEFQCRQFGVHGFVSAPRPEDLACGERFDCILVSSLFTHLPEDTFAGWLRRLWELLAPGGVLAFSVHDAALLPAGVRLPPGGLLFAPSSESGSLAAADYGSTWVSEGFVRAALRCAAPAASALHLPRALANFQDLYVAVAEPCADFTGLRLAGASQAFVEHCAWTPPDALQISGWVADRAGGRLPVEVRALIAGEVKERCRAFSPRPDVSALFPAERVAAVGWRLQPRLAGEPPDLSARLRLEAVAADGEVSTLDESSVEGALLRSTRLQLFLDHAAHQRLAVEHARLAADHAALTADRAALRAALEHTVAAYEGHLAALGNEMDR